MFLEDTNEFGFSFILFLMLLIETISVSIDGEFCSDRKFFLVTTLIDIPTLVEISLKEEL